MSLMIENIDDLRRLLKQTGVKINNVEDLNSLFRSINEGYDPDAASLASMTHNSALPRLATSISEAC